MPLFVNSEGQRVKFRLVNLTSQEHSEITRIITENGGEVVESCRCPVLSFTNASRCNCNGMYDVRYIRDCARMGRILDVTAYKLGTKSSLDGCPMSLLLFSIPCCFYRLRRENQVDREVQTSPDAPPAETEQDNGPAAATNETSAGGSETTKPIDRKDDGDKPQATQKPSTSTFHVDKRPCFREYQNQVLPKLRALEYISARLKAKILGERLKQEEPVEKRKPTSLKRKKSCDHYDVKCKRLKLESKEDKAIESVKNKSEIKTVKSMKVSAPSRQNLPKKDEKPPKARIVKKKVKELSENKFLRVRVKDSVVKKSSKTVGKSKRKSKRKQAKTKKTRHKKATKTLSTRALAKMPKYFIVVDPSSDEELHHCSRTRKKKAR